MLLHTNTNTEGGLRLVRRPTPAALPAEDRRGAGEAPEILAVINDHDIGSN